MKKIILLLTATIVFFACNQNKADNADNNDKGNEKVVYAKNQKRDTTKGYQLMQQKCFICHMEKPSFSKKASMIAPPMVRIQEHYKPTYNNKDEFVKAIVNFVSNPDEKNALMPGAVRKFNLMPNLGYSKEEIKLIAETLFEIDFGTMPKMKMKHNGSLSLNKGEKWKLKAESMEAINSIIEKLNKFQSENVADYNQLGREVFNLAKTILLDTDYKGEILDQIHYFFGNLEGLIHNLEATNSLDEAKQLLNEIKKQFAEFGNYFEAR